MSIVDLMAEGRIYWTLRSLLVSRHEQLATFDSLFARFWNFQPLPRVKTPTNTSSKFGETRTTGRVPRALALPEEDDESKDTLIQLVRTGASGRHVTSETDLSVLDSQDMSELSRIASRIVRALASKPGRRRKRHRRKGTPDLRSAMRMSLTTGGDPVRLPRMRRVPKVPRLLVALDVSGSMDRYARLLLLLMFAEGQLSKRVEAFVFSTTVTRVTRELSSPSFSEALTRIGRAVNHWSGGTRIGESLADLNTNYDYLLNRHTTVFLLSDGWETGDPNDLAQALRRIQRRVRSVVWLNPLLGTRDFQPLARGLQAAVPYVDHFVPAADVEHLKRLPALLRS